MKKIILAVITVLTVTFATAGPALAIDVFNQCDDPANQNLPICVAAKKDTLFGPDSLWNRVLNTVTYIAGAIAVLMIIIGGIRYTTANGDQQQITSAKNTVLYSLVGLVLAIMANAIVNFVLSRI